MNEPLTVGPLGRRSGRWGRALVVALLLGGLPASLSAIQVPFGAQQTIAAADGASALVVADVDRDGDADLLTASSEDDTIAWHENDGSQGWTTHVIAIADSAVSVFAADLDRDGDVDVLAASDLDDTVAWHENDGAQAFTPHVISTAADGAHSVSAADIDGDGDLDLLAASAFDDTITWFENDGSQGFTPHTVTTSADLVVSVRATDLDRDGDIDLLAASAFDDTIAWFENDGSQAFTIHPITTTADGAASAVATDLDRDGDLDVLVTAALDDTVTWWENDGLQSFTSHDITTTADGAQSAVADDVDLDGDLDVVVASAVDGTVAWWENDGAQGFTARVLTTTAGSPVMVDTADLDGDGDTDVLAASFGDDSFGWFEDLAIHRSATFPSPVTLPADTIGDRLVVGDIDRDGDLDLVFHRDEPHAREAVVLALNLTGDGSAWAENVVFAGFFPGTGLNLSLGDADGDGDPDVFGTDLFGGQTWWLENPTGEGGLWTQHLMPSSSEPGDIEVSDIDGDGDLDAATTSLPGEELAWFENLVGDGSAWTETVIAGPPARPFFVAPGDIDRDGDQDLASVMYQFGGGLEPDLLFYENTAGDGTAWNPHLIAPADAAAALGDVDGDDDLDAVVLEIGSGGADDRLAWQENAAGDGSLWTEHVVRTAAAEPRDLVVADLDVDGDTDIVSRFVTGPDQAIWFENRAPGNGTAWREHPIFDPATDHHRLAAADIDRDGAPDLISFLGFQKLLAWYPNRGGQFALATTVTAPGTIAPTLTDDIFAIDAFHRGRAGDLDLELATFELLFEEGAGDPLTTAEVNALIETLEIYLDDGSGVFDPADTLVTSSDSLALTAGIQIVALPDGGADVRVTPAASRTYFVTVEMTADADQQNPPHFRATHLTESGSSAEDVQFDLRLVIEFAADTTTETIEARPALIFADGFESGNTSAWTSSVP